MLDALMLAVGLAVLLGGAWLLVRAAALLAIMFGLSRVLVGATIVAFGTSAPEFVVNILAAFRDSPELAVGNVLGSNVANVALVLGLGAVISPMLIHSRLLRWEIPALAIATVILLVVASSGSIDRIEGSVMFLALIVFLVLSVRLFPESIEAEIEPVSEAELPPIGTIIGQLIVGFVGLAGGAELLVRGATGLAETIGISELAIGAFVVALGTSLPEAATTAVAALRREHEIAVANVVGSNVFNILGVLGLNRLPSPPSMSTATSTSSKCPPSPSARSSSSPSPCDRAPSAAPRAQSSSSSTSPSSSSSSSAPDPTTHRGPTPLRAPTSTDLQGIAGAGNPDASARRAQWLHRAAPLAPGSTMFATRGQTSVHPTSRLGLRPKLPGSTSHQPVPADPRRVKPPIERASPTAPAPLPSTHPPTPRPTRCAEPSSCYRCSSSAQPSASSPTTPASPASTSGPAPATP